MFFLPTVVEQDLILFILSIPHRNILLLTSAVSTQRYYIAVGLEEEERQENKKLGVKRKW